MDNLALYLQPIVSNAAQWFGCLVIGWLAVEVKRYTAFTISQATKAELVKRFTDFCLASYAGADALIDTEALTKFTPAVASAIRNIETYLPQFLTKYNIDSAELERRVLAIFGAKQNGTLLVTDAAVLADKPVDVPVTVIAVKTPSVTP